VRQSGPWRKPGGLSALALAVQLGRDDARYAKYGTLVGAYSGLILFVIVAGVQGLS
jgi:hypothetical protein